MIFDEQEGWIISSTGGIWHTENSGGTWLGSDYPNVISRGLHGLFFSDIARFPGNTIHEIRMQDLPSGIYFLYLYNEGFVLTKKIFLIR